MIDVLFLVLKVLVIASLAMLIGYKTGLFSMGRVPSVICFAIILVFFSAELYSSLYASDISFVAIFRSSFLNFTWDLSFFIRIFLLTLLAGLICSVFDIKPTLKIGSAKELCSLAILIAIAVVLAIYGTIRIGSGIKISFKFIPVFIASAVFGPMWGGMIGALADIVAFMVSPVGGAFLPQITMVEFLYGFTYGLFFFNMSKWDGYRSLINIVVCVILQITVLNLWLTTKLLMPIMNMNFNALLTMRAVPGLINMAIQLIVISVMSKYISTFRKTLR